MLHNTHSAGSSIGICYKYAISGGSSIMEPIRIPENMRNGIFLMNLLVVLNFRVNPLEQWSALTGKLPKYDVIIDRFIRVRMRQQTERSFSRSLGIESTHGSARKLDDFLSERCERSRKRSRSRHGQCRIIVCRVVN